MLRLRCAEVLCDELLYALQQRRCSLEDVDGAELEQDAERDALARKAAGAFRIGLRRWAARLRQRNILEK